MKTLVLKTKEELIEAVKAIKAAGYDGWAYTANSYKPIDKNDRRTPEDRTVKLDDGTEFVQPRRRLDVIEHSIISDDEELIACATKATMKWRKN